MNLDEAMMVRELCEELKFNCPNIYLVKNSKYVVGFFMDSTEINFPKVFTGVGKNAHCFDNVNEFARYLVDENKMPIEDIVLWRLQT